jgi:hypothetical protein
MQLREPAVRVVLIVSALASVATSVATYEISDTAEGVVRGPGVSRVRVLLNDVAVEEAESIRVDFRRRDQRVSGDIAIDVVPDHQELEAFVLGAVHSVEASAACAGPGACEIGFSLHVEAEADVPLEITARLGRLGDGSLLFPDDRDFSDAARVEVRLER